MASPQVDLSSSRVTRLPLPPPPLLFWSAFHCFSVKFSPYKDHLAVATAQHYGLAGNGRVHVVSLSGAGAAAQLAAYDTKDGLFDVAWSEVNEHQLIGACGDGSVVLWDLRAHDGLAVARWSEHTQEAVCASWAPVSKRTFATASWDGTVRIFDPTRSASLVVLTAGAGGAAAGAAAVHAVEWHPTHASTLASGGAAGGVTVWDVRARDAQLRVGGGGRELAGETLTLDWNKFREFFVVTGGADGAVKVWDSRRPAQPVRLMLGHRLPVRRVRCCPHAPNVVASASYDSSVCFWDDDAGTAALHAPLLQRCAHHREFACGVEFSLFSPGVVASCSWDRSVRVWDSRGPQPPPAPPPPGSDGKL